MQVSSLGGGEKISKFLKLCFKKTETITKYLKKGYTQAFSTINT